MDDDEGNEIEIFLDCMQGLFLQNERDVFGMGRTEDGTEATIGNTKHNVSVAAAYKIGCGVIKITYVKLSSINKYYTVNKSQPFIIYTCNMQNVVIKPNHNPYLAGSQHLTPTSRISIAFYPALVHRSLAAVYPFLLSVEYNQPL